MPEHVIAIDPGHRTGWARALVSENRIEYLEHGVLTCKEMALELHQMQVRCDEPSFYDAIVYETWRPRPQKGSMAWIQGNELIEVQLVGQIRLCGWLSGAKLKGYGPDRKRAFTASMPAAMLARFPLSHEQHDQDALMHLWMYAFENWVTDPSNVTID
jgi:hypothetical protein